MESLQLPQILEILKNPGEKSKAIAEKALSIQKKKRSDVHCETITQIEEFHSGHYDFLKWIESSVLEDTQTFNSFRGLVRPPFSTNELTESIFAPFEKIFKSDNSLRKYEFEDEELEADAIKYTKKLGITEFFETVAFDKFKSDIDSILVVDLPEPEYNEAGEAIETDDLPEPYPYFISVDDLLAIDVSRYKIKDDEISNLYNYVVNWIAFECGKDEVAFIDNKKYYKFKKVGSEYELLNESEHFLEYCPAKPFWSSPLNQKSLIQKKSPITNSLTNLDWLLFVDFAKKYQDTFGMFPIYAMYAAKCDYKDTTLNQQCKGGLLHSTIGGAALYDYTAGQKTVKKCPKCSDKMRKGPGKTIVIKAPHQEGQPDLMRNPLQIISPDVKSLEHITKEIERIKHEIYSDCVGRGSDVVNKQAINEAQADGIYESKRMVLSRVKKNFEIIEKFATDTVFRLRYQEDYKGSVIDYGEPYFYEDTNDLMESYKEGKTNGMPSFFLNSIRKRIYESKYKNDPTSLARHKILSHLEPYQNYTLEEIIEIQSKNPIFDRNLLILKADFDKYVNRFEREVGNVVDFMSKQSMEIKINTILTKLLEYVTESEQGAGEGRSSESREQGAGEGRSSE
jgi:hypothetical protein